MLGDIPVDPVDKSITDASLALTVELFGVTDGVEEVEAEGGNIEPDNVPLGCSP